MNYLAVCRCGNCKQTTLVSLRDEVELERFNGDTTLNCIHCKASTTDDDDFSIEIHNLYGGELSKVINLPRRNGHAYIYPIRNCVTSTYKGKTDKALEGNAWRVVEWYINTFMGQSVITYRVEDNSYWEHVRTTDVIVCGHPDSVESACNSRIYQK